MSFHTLIASDIDGTLIPEETTIIPEAVYAQVRTAREKGFLFMAASAPCLHRWRIRWHF